MTPTAYGPGSAYTGADRSGVAVPPAGPDPELHPTTNVTAATANAAHRTA